MVIFHSYGSLPEGNPPENSGKGSIDSIYLELLTRLGLYLYQIHPNSIFMWGTIGHKPTLVGTNNAFLHILCSINPLHHVFPWIYV